jgi:peptidoglycan/xylan/chitin deacetylase (PgdA/CDA1 family)
LTESRVALTIDTEFPDQPRADPDGPSRILDAFAERNVVATFLVVAEWVAAYPEVASTIARDGHLLGSHSLAHIAMRPREPAAIVRDLNASAVLIEKTTGIDPRPWFRLPYMEGDTDREVLDAVREAGFEHVRANVDPHDWRPGLTTGEIVRAVVHGVRARHRDGRPAVVLLHSWPAHTVKALPAMLDELQGHGAELIRIDGLSPAERRALPTTPSRLPPLLRRMAHRLPANRLVRPRSQRQPHPS